MAEKALAAVIQEAYIQGVSTRYGWTIWFRRRAIIGRLQEPGLSGSANKSTIRSIRGVTRIDRWEARLPLPIWLDATYG